MKISTTLAAKFDQDPMIGKNMFNYHRNQEITAHGGIQMWNEYLRGIGETDDNYFMDVSFLMEHGLLGDTIYLVRETALEIARKIKVNEEMHFQYLNRIPEGHFVFIDSKDSFYKFFRIFDHIHVLHFSCDAEEYHYKIYRFDLKKSYKYLVEDEKGKIVVDLFFQLCIFWQFSDPEVVVLEEGRKVGTRKAGKITNDSPFKVRMIDSTWNKIIIRTDGFDVDGHLRLQPCGEGMKDRKLIWINPFKKKGYIRKGGLKI